MFLIIQCLICPSNHVIGDLEPFICIFSDCLETGQHGTSPRTFESSKAWISHMQNAHEQMWECKAPSHNLIMFDEEFMYWQHVIQEHGVPEERAGDLCNAARRPNLDRVLGCPFGDDFQPPEEVEPNAVFSSEALQLHVAAHIKEIALLTLQKLPGDGDEIAENVDSDQPLEDDGPGLVNRRDSMYSILDDGDLDFREDPETADDTWDHRTENINASVTVLDLEDKDDSGMTKLHHATQAGDLRLVESLISEGVNLGSRDNAGRTALHYASMEQFNGPEIMGLLLKAGGQAIVNQGDNNGQTALHYAAERGFTNSIRFLVDNGADINTTDDYGFSPFLWAVVAGDGNAAIILLDMGSDVNSTSGDGKSALAWAACLSRTPIVQSLILRGASMSGAQNTHIEPLKEAAASGDVVAAMSLLYASNIQGYDCANDRDRDGWSAIHWAAEEGHEQIVDMLLERGADVNAASSYGTSPLHCAANGGNTDIVRLLLQRGADPLKSTCHGWTALHHAAFMGHSQTVQILLKDDRVRSSASQQDNHGWSVLHLAVHSRDLATLEVLLDHSVIAESRELFDESGLTAEDWLDLNSSSHSYKATSNLAFSKSRCCKAVTGLRQAVILGHVPMINLLIRMGNDVNGSNSERRTALYYAVKKRMLSIMDLLFDNGADPNILPVGRKSWEEFVSNDEVLQRLYRAGYERRRIYSAAERKIRLAIRGQGQFSVPHRAVSFAPDETISPMSWQPIPPVSGHTLSSVPASSAPPFSDNSAPETTAQINDRRILPDNLSPAPAPQTNDNKRKLETNRSRETRVWKRLRREL